MSTGSSHAQPIVAIVGATGNLGTDISEAFLKHYRPHFSQVIAVVRDPTSANARKLADAGAELRQIDTTNVVLSFARAFTGVDVVVSAVSMAPVEYHDALFDGALKAGVKVYFPSEFGMNYHLIEFREYGEPIWDAKAQHVARARELAQGKIKIIVLATGLFAEYVLTLMPPLNQPWFEFDAATLTFAFAGSPDSKLAITAKADIARSVAQLTLLALSPDLAVPDVVYVAGQNASYREIGQAIEGVSGESGAERKKVTLNAADLESYKIAAREEEVRTGKPNILKHIKYGIRLLLNIVTDPRLWRRQDRTRGAQDGLLI
ncbi:hypothetical protein IEO21_06664 [Rhodonia placenta]|uniref:NmrA-like domain-containing protein n=1 Tax=Rhodonia placenta TaxID=104341 RepID=A0A8H7NZL8_9APHY|nr:hypothetical protein IEO21_06664 [Postia placenta]